MNKKAPSIEWGLLFTGLRKRLILRSGADFQAILSPATVQLITNSVYCCCKTIKIPFSNLDLFDQFLFSKTRGFKAMFLCNQPDVLQ